MEQHTQQRLVQLLSFAQLLWGPLNCRQPPEHAEQVCLHNLLVCCKHSRKNSGRHHPTFTSCFCCQACPQDDPAAAAAAAQKRLLRSRQGCGFCTRSHPQAVSRLLPLLLLLTTGATSPVAALLITACAGSALATAAAAAASM